VKDAVLIKEHESDSLVTIFYIDMRAFGRGFQEFVNRAKSEFGIQFIRSNPGEISEDPNTNNLVIWYEDPITRTATNQSYDMVVLCPALIPSRGMPELADALGVELDNYGFVKMQDTVRKPLDTNIPGIFCCGYCLGPKTGDIPDSITQGSAAAGRVAEALANVEEQ
jgi:heterodisulfide reductase subunit A